MPVVRATDLINLELVGEYVVGGEGVQHQPKHPLQHKEGWGFINVNIECKPWLYCDMSVDRMSVNRMLYLEYRICMRISVVCLLVRVKLKGQTKCEDDLSCDRLLP